MKDFKGTKGSWKLDDYGHELVVSSKTGGQHVVTMRVINSRQEKKANAQLIATAPELLAVLLRVMSTYRVRVSMPSDLIEECEEVINKALGNE